MLNPGRFLGFNPNLEPRPPPHWNLTYKIHTGMLSLLVFANILRRNPIGTVGTQEHI